LIIRPSSLEAAIVFRQRVEVILQCEISRGVEFSAQRPGGQR
jgi:hypothetical protein